ncbi:MAG: hypothetical protein C5B52_10735 [Bacteroidetes bacterium]|nr:MAG: hypothetical protein C5B52_10735 [Bacteroidota bacterium]
MENRSLLIIWMVVLISQNASGQDYYYDNQYYDQPLLFQTGIFLGGMNCLTDLGGQKGAGKNFVKDVNWMNTKPMMGFYLGMMYRYFFSGKLIFSLGKVSAYDSVLSKTQTESDLRFQRNLSFKSSIHEIAIVTQWYPWNILTGNTGRGRQTLAPYLLLGVGLFHFSPQAKLDKNWIKLQELHTEGQGFREYPDRIEYKLTQTNKQLGLGFRYEISALFDISAEINWRILKTDYLDDVSAFYVDPNLFDKYLNPDEAAIAKRLADRQQEKNPMHVTREGDKRGSPDKNDSYFTFSVNFGYTFNRTKR